MKTIAALALLTTVLTLAGERPAIADVSGNTEVDYYRDSWGYDYWTNREYLLGDHQEGTYGAAFFDGVMFAYKVYSMVSGAQLMAAMGPGVTGANLVSHAISRAGSGTAAGLWQAKNLMLDPSFPLSAMGFMDSFFSMLNNLGDKFSVQTKKIKIARSDYSKLILTFSVWSDDDPFGHLEGNQLFEQAGVEIRKVVRRWKYAEGAMRPLIADIIVTLRPRLMNRGIHTIAFNAKETDCASCLGFTHNIQVEITDPCGPTTSICTYYNGREQYWRDRLGERYDEQRTLLQSDAAGVHEAVNAWKHAENVCLHRGAPSTAAYNSCVDANDSAFSNYCPDAAFGSGYSACSRLRQLETDITNYHSWANWYQQAYFSSNCCRMTSGGNAY